MRTVLDCLLGALAAAAVTGAACAQPAPSAASAPATAASRTLPARNPAVVAAENAKEPGNQRPEERVIPQISIPLKPRNSAVAPANAASASASGPSGGVHDAAARCLAARDADARTACEQRERRER